MQLGFGFRWAVAAIAALMSLSPAVRAQSADAGTAVMEGGLAGTLLKPAGAEVAVLIIAGSGPTDRDGNNTAGLRTDAYKQLAEALAKSKIASLRYDKRGIGASKLDAKGEPVKEESLTIQTFADDTAALTSWLKGQGFKRVVLIGHSEGALLALLAANKAKADRLVLLNPAGFPLGQVLRKQFVRQPLPDEAATEIERVLVALEQGGDPGKIKEPVDRLFRPSVQPFLKSVLSLDPVPLVKELQQPILLIGGGNDIQVGRLDIEELMAARAGIQVHWEPRLTHVLKAALEDDPAQTKAYSDPTQPVMPEIVTAITKFAIEP